MKGVGNDSDFAAMEPALRMNVREQGHGLSSIFLSHALLVSASKEYYFYPKNRNSNEGEEGFFFLSFFKREIRFTTKNRGCNIDIERRRIRTRSRRNIWRRGDDFWRKITKQFAILV